MDKQWKRFVKRMERLWENVCKGNVADIAILVSGVALAGTLVTVFVVQLLPKDDVPAVASSVETSSVSAASSAAPSASNTGDDAVNPFPQESASQSASSKAPASSSKKPAASSKKPAVSSSAPPASSAPATSTPPPVTSTPTPPTTVHTHTYPATWTREGADCVVTTEVRHCTTCSDANAVERRNVGITGAHAFGNAQVVMDPATGKLLYTLETCPKCNTEKKAYPIEGEGSSSSSSSGASSSSQSTTP